MIQEEYDQKICSSMETTELEERKSEEGDFSSCFDTDIHTSEKKPSNSYLSWFQRSNSKNLVNADDDKDNFATSREIDDLRKESLLAKTVRNIRNKFIDRHLHGKIFIQHRTGIFSSACTCDITVTDRKSVQG